MVRDKNGARMALQKDDLGGGLEYCLSEGRYGSMQSVVEVR